MRILMLNHNVAERGGTYFRAFDVARYLTKRGHEVCLLTISPSRRWGFDHIVKDGVEIVHTPDLFWGRGRTGWDPWDTLHRIIFLHKKKWDIIHAWDSRPAVILPALYARRQSRNSKLIIDWCDWWGRGGTIQERSGWAMRTFFGPLETFFEESFRVHADGGTVISHALYDRAQQLGVPADTLHILQQGCDIEETLPSDRMEARQQLGIPGTVSLIGYLGALGRSDAALLYDTLRILIAHDQQFQFVLMGNHRSRIPDDLRETQRITETGYVSASALQQYLAACDVLFCPLGDTIASRARWPSKVNTYLAAGRATVMTRVGDLAALLESEDAGIVTSCNPEEIVTQLIKLLGNVEMRAKYEVKARSMAEKLAWPGLIRQLESFYDNMSD